MLEDFIADAEDREKKLINAVNVKTTEMPVISVAINNLLDGELSEKLESLDSRADGTVKIKRERLLIRITGEYIPNDFRDSSGSRQVGDTMLHTYPIKLDNIIEKSWKVDILAATTANIVKKAKADFWIAIDREAVIKPEAAIDRKTADSKLQPKPRRE